MIKNKYQLTPFSLLVFMFCVGVVLASSSSFADSVVDEVNITVSVSCTMSGTGMDTHDAEIPNGTYEDEIGTTTLQAFCNDSNGFAVYATGYTGNTIGETNSNKLVGVNTNTTIETGLATSAGNPDISNWAMKLTKTQDSGDTTGTNAFTIDSAPNETNGAAAPFTSYHVIPNTYTKVAHKDSNTDMTAVTGGVKLTTTYAAYISKTQPADTYSGQVIYTLVHPANEVPLQPQPCEAGKICYHSNANPNMITGEMGKQTVTNGESATLYASNYKHDGYGFAGWNDRYDYTGTFYGANQTITAPNDIEVNGLSLYAVWVKSTGSLQDSTKVATLCGTDTGGLTQDPNDGTADLTTVTALTDDRDGNTYAIAKLADGKCWMIENLRLADKDSGNNDIVLSSQNTHNPSLPITNVFDATNPTTSNHLSSPTDPTQTAWCTANTTACNDQSMLATNNTTLYLNNAVSSYDASSNVFSYGNYYNWYSATAGHGKYGSGNGSSFVTAGDICPAGWHLPTGSTTGEFYVLNTAVNNGATNYTASRKIRSFPNNFVYSGSLSGSSIYSRNSAGYYWSASGDNIGVAYNMSFGSSNVVPGTIDFYNYPGWTVRCISGV